MKMCLECNKLRREDYFYRHENMCKRCRNIKYSLNKKQKPNYLKKLVKRNQKYNKKYPEKHLAHRKVAAAKLLGILVKPDRCVYCNKKTTKIQAHHEDYGKPLDVIWLCYTCHAEVHKNKATPLQSGSEFKTKAND